MAAAARRGEPEQIDGRRPRSLSPPSRSTLQRPIAACAGWLLLSGAALLLWALVASLFAVDVKEYGLVTRFGKVVRVVARARPSSQGAVRRVARLDRRLTFSRPAPAEYLTVDKKNVVVESLATWHIADPERFLGDVATRSNADVRAGRMSSLGEIGAVLGKYPAASLIAPDGERGAVPQDRLRDPWTRVAGFARTAYGIEIVDVELLHLSLPEQNREHVFERMKAERGKMAKEYRTAGELQASKIIAEADRERSHIEAESYAQAQRLKAEGDAEASRIYAGCVQPESRFYKFLRTSRPTRSFWTRARRCFFPPMRRCCACSARSAPVERRHRSAARRRRHHAQNRCEQPVSIGGAPRLGRARDRHRPRSFSACSRSSNDRDARGQRTRHAAHRGSRSQRPCDLADLAGRCYWIGLLALARCSAPTSPPASTSSMPTSTRWCAGSEPSRPASVLACTIRLPWPVDRVDVLKTTSVMKVGVGFALTENDSQPMTGVEVLTGDTNILSVALVVQYVIVNPSDYLVSDRAAAKAGGNDGAKRTDGDGGRHADRRGVDHRPARHPGASQAQDPGGSGPLPERNPDLLGQHHEHHAGRVGRAGVPGCRRRHGGPREAQNEARAYSQRPDPESARRGRTRR